jgi:hypothetical protein
VHPVTAARRSGRIAVRTASLGCRSRAPLPSGAAWRTNESINGDSGHWEPVATATKRPRLRDEHYRGEAPPLAAGKGKRTR